MQVGVDWWVGLLKAEPGEELAWMEEDHMMLEVLKILDQVQSEQEVELWEDDPVCV